MNQKTLRSLGLLLLFLLAGCASIRERMHREPALEDEQAVGYPDGDPRTAIAHVAQAARSRALEVSEEKREVTIQIGEWTEINFAADKQSLTRTVSVAGKAPAADKVKLLEEAKALSQAIWEQASVAWAAAKARQEVEASRDAEAQRQINIANARREAAEAESGARPATTGSQPNPAFKAFMEEHTDHMNAMQPAPSAASSAAPSSAAASSSQSTGATLTCCLNGVGYVCPDSQSVRKCGGEFAECMMGCGMNGNSRCENDCTRNHSPDPSRCTRDSSGCR